MAALLACLGRIHEALSSDGALAAFDEIAEALSEAVSLAWARLALEGRAASWGDPGEKCVPLTVPVGELGALDLELFESPSADERDFLDAVASALALALEREAARASAAAAAHRLVEVLAAVCHDIRSPLGTVFLCCSLIERARRNGTLESRVEKDVDAIRGGAEQIGRFVEDLAELRHIEAGDLELELTLEDPAALVAAAAGPARSPVLERRAIALVSDARAGLPAVRADRARVLRSITRIVEHLAIGAPRGSRIALSAFAEGGSVSFAVETPALAPLEEGVFGGHSPGSGFALPIVAHVVREHGGRTFAGSRGGVARLGFSLPAASSSARAA